jgi:hypothetical protein
MRPSRRVGSAAHPRWPWPAETRASAAVASRAPYFTGIMRCWYGVPGHMTYGFLGSPALLG